MIQTYRPPLGVLHRKRYERYESGRESRFRGHVGRVRLQRASVAVWRP